jgi:Prefoldin subunit
VPGQKSFGSSSGSATLGTGISFKLLKWFVVCADEKLELLSGRLSSEVMVPLTSKAFMLGQLVHTNEIMVLLGENYFIGNLGFYFLDCLNS